MIGTCLNFVIDRSLHTHHVSKVKVTASTRPTQLWDEGQSSGVCGLGGLRISKRASCLHKGNLLFLY